MILIYKGQIKKLQNVWEISYLTNRRTDLTKGLKNRMWNLETTDNRGRYNIDTTINRNDQPRRGDINIDITN